MKMLRKLLLIIPIVAIGFTLLFAFVTIWLGLGDGIAYRVTGSNAIVWGDAYEIESNLDGIVEMAIGNTFFFLGWFGLVASFVLVLLNFNERNAKGPTLLIAGILCFFIQFCFLVRPIMLIYYRTREVGNVFEGFNWTTFGFSTILWFNCITLFILNKTLFKKVLAGDQTKPQEEKTIEHQPEPQPKQEAPVEEIKEEVKAAELKADNGWYCPECGKHNTGAYCEDCGTKKPV